MLNTKAEFYTWGTIAMKLEDFFTVPTKKPRVMFTCDESLKDALEAWADKESRTVSNLCELIVRKAAQNAGYLKVDQLTEARQPRDDRHD